MPHPVKKVDLLKFETTKSVTATRLNEICTDVQIEPQLHSREHFDTKTANKHRDARLDILMGGFWCSGHKALFDITVFNPIAP